MDKPIVLVVDDDPFFRRFCEDSLTKAGLTVKTAVSGAEALRICEEEPVALLVVDVYMPEMSGIEILEAIKSQRPSIDVVVTTGYASVDTAVQALKKGASDYLRKPFAAEELTAAVGNIMAQRRLYQVNEELRSQLRLYELSRSFAAVEEPPRVAFLGVDSLREVAEADAVFCAVVAESGEELEVSASRGIDFSQKQPDMRKTLELWREECLPKLKMMREATPDEFSRWFGDALPKEFDRALLVPLLLEGAPVGFFALLRAAGKEFFAARVLQDVDFLGGQVSLAYKTAARLQEAKGLAYVDSLTDLYNARYLPLVLEKRMAEARQAGQPLSLLFLDLDNFRDVNTRYGHQSGGKALIEVAWILEGNVRAGDTVIRYGGDEFTIVLPNADTDRAREIAERMRKTIREHVFLSRENKVARFTVCIGVATFPTDATTPEMLIHLADQAMYRGKETTRDVVSTVKGGRTG
jgi:diguanylate cyclase (GGDEF)-like protein